MADGTPDTFRDALCEAAVAYTAAGWPIVPTEAPTFHHPVCNRPPASTAEARDWWSDRPYGIACAVGHLFDVIDVPALIGRGMLLRLSQTHAPVLRVHDDHGNEHWRFLVTPGSPRITDLPRDSPVSLLKRGRAIALPPTPAEGVGTQWVAYAPTTSSTVHTLPPTPPEVLSLRGLPHSLQVQWTALRTVVAARASIGPDDAHSDDSLGSRLRQDYERGASINALSRQLGRSPKYVRRLLREAGTTFRQSGYRSPRDLVIWRAPQP